MPHPLAPLALVLSSLSLLHASTVPEQLFTPGQCHADDHCGGKGVPIQTYPSKSIAIWATCHSFMPNVQKGYVCFKLGCGDCVPIVTGICVIGGYWVEWCPDIPKATTQ